MCSCVFHFASGAPWPLSAVSAAAQTKLDVKDIENHPFTADFNANGKLRMYLRSGDFRIEGSDGNKITVRIRGRNADQAADMRVQLEGSNDSAESDRQRWPQERPGSDHRGAAEDRALRADVRGKPGIAITSSGIRMWRCTRAKWSLMWGMPAIIRASMLPFISGGLEAHPFGESHGGLFRSFHKEGNGRYRLHAHVGAGDLTLQ